MSLISFPTGDPLWWDIEDMLVTPDYAYMLCLATWVPDPTTEVFRDDIVANEMTDGSYPGPVSATFVDVGPGNGVTRSLLTGRWKFITDDPDFGNLVGGEDIGWMVFYANTGVDSTSTLMAAYPIEHTADGSPFAPRINTAGLTRVGIGTLA
jgi:hypothetical protein